MKYIPDMFCILDSNASLTTKVQALENQLNDAHSVRVKKSKYNLISLEKWIDFASHMVEADFDKKEAALKITPITNALGLLQQFPIPELWHGCSSLPHLH